MDSKGQPVGPVNVGLHACQWLDLERFSELLAQLLAHVLPERMQPVPQRVCGVFCGQENDFPSVALHPTGKPA